MGNTRGRALSQRGQVCAFALLSLGVAGLNWVGSAASARAEESHPGMNAEVLYSEAVISLSRKQTRQALEILEDLLKKYPKHIEGLELKALTLKNEGDDERAIASYKELLALRPPKERGAYHFELGVIYQRQKKDDLAKAHLESALKLRFNATICRFFLGMLEFGKNNYKHAEYYFRKVSREDQGELKLVSHYYLGLTQLKSGYPLGATRDLSAARDLASTLPDNKNAAEIKTSAEQILLPFSQPQWFANVAMLGTYDSNISQIPTSLSSSSEASGKSTGKVSLSAGFGRMTAPMDTLQFVGNYRFGLNKNLNTQTRTYEFVSNSVQLYLNYMPLSPTQGGFKAEGNFLFQNQVQDGASATDSSARFKYGKYNLSGEFGPFFRYQPTRRIQTELDIYLRPQKYFTDDGLTGTALYSRLSIKGDFYSKYFNPGGSVSYENNSAKSDTYKSNSIGLGISNQLKLTAEDSVTAYIDFLSTKYPKSSPLRSDTNLSIRVNAVHTFNPKWAMLGDASYVNNKSSISDSYTYNRMTFGLGVSYSM